MKTKMNFRQIAAIIVLIVVGSLSGFAQTWTTQIAGELTDSVAIGSRARYQVTPSVPANPALYRAAGFVWSTFKGLPITDTTGAALTPAVVADSGANQAAISIVPATLGLDTVYAAEFSRPKLGVGCVDATPEKLPVFVVPMPTLSYGADSGSCAAPATLQVPANVTGFGKYDVLLHIQAYEIDGVTMRGVAQDYPLTLQRNVRTTESGKAIRFAVPVATLNLAASTIPPAGCKFEISATNLQDRLSRKHRGYVFPGTTPAAANAGDPDLADVYNFWVYPLPVTSPIQHIQNAY